jgi:Putative Ig domain
MIKALAALFLVAVCVTPAAAQDHYPLAIIRPLAQGAAGVGLDPEHRIFRAYQGVTYTIKTEAVGGHWPYTYSLSGAPAGMVVEAGPCTQIGPACTAGTITWTNPQTTDSSITVTVTDADGDQVSATWGVTVNTTACGVDGWCFIDPVNGNDTTGNGSRAAPWRTIDKCFDSCGARAFVYLRAGVHATTGMPVATEECGQQITWHESLRPVVFMGYPGETATVDFANTFCFQPNGQNIWWSNVRFLDCEKMCLQIVRLSRYGVTFWDNDFEGQGPGVGGLNSAFLMWTQMYGGGGVLNTQGYFDVVDGNRFSGSVEGNGNSCLKMYSWLRGLVANNEFTNSTTTECVAIKSDDSDVTIRANRILVSASDQALGGNNHQVTDQTSAEILHNLVISPSGYAYRWNQDGQAGAFHVWRNTFVGRVLVTNADAVDGPLTVARTVIQAPTFSSTPTICATLRLTCSGVAAPTRIVDGGENLVGASGLVDASGNLTGTNTQYVGARGYQLGVSGPLPPAPTRLRVTSVQQ